MSNKKQDQFGFFLEFVIGSQDIKLEDKINIMIYYADEFYIKDDTLRYLECMSIVNELKKQRKPDES